MNEGVDQHPVKRSASRDGLAAVAVILLTLGLIALVVASLI